MYGIKRAYLEGRVSQVPLFKGDCILDKPIIKNPKVPRMTNNMSLNVLYYGDNLIMMRHIKDNFVDLIYLDPPFNSKANYNVLYKELTGEPSEAQMTAFEDTWHWTKETELTFTRILEEAPVAVIEIMSSFRNFVGHKNDIMAYLTMMCIRLLEMKRVLKNTGSIYLHCDPTASHYLKLLMDAIFGVANFRNEIIWHYRTGGISKRWFGSKHDIIFFYSKTEKYKFNPIEVKEYYKDIYGIDFKPSWKDRKGGKDENGYYHFVYKDDVWDISAVFNMSKEYIGYPTQKPEKLLETIIKANSDREDLVLDPFCGCGTTIAVAERLSRRWMGIDITYLAIDVISKRLKASGIKENTHYAIDGEPKEVYSAKKLAGKDPFQFQIWCISKLNATPLETKSADRGVDGVINFFDPSKSSKVGKAIIQVKGTENVNPAMVRDLKGTLKSQNADFGILITFSKPTRGMIEEAVKEGYFKFIGKEVPKIQFLTVEDLFKEPIPIKLPHSFIFEPYRKPVIEKELEKELQQTLFKQK